jgi:hypothetical protein
MFPVDAIHHGPNASIASSKRTRAGTASIVVPAHATGTAGVLAPARMSAEGADRSDQFLCHPNISVQACQVLLQHRERGFDLFLLQRERNVRNAHDGIPSLQATYAFEKTMFFILRLQWVPLQYKFMMKPKEDLEMLLAEAEDMYVNQMMPIKAVVKKFRDEGRSITLWRLCDRLHNKNLTRTPTQTLIYQRLIGKVSNTCVINGCSNQCMGRRKYCRTCIPDGTAHITYLRHGLTHPQIDAMLASQGGVCAGCLQLMCRGGRAKAKSQCVDHDHITGDIRGILCRGCNTTLGSAKDSAATLRRLAAYLDVHSVIQTTSMQS